jgi:hypothetical protein
LKTIGGLDKSQVITVIKIELVVCKPMNPGIRTLFSLGGALAVSVGSIGLGFLAPLPVNAASFTIMLPEFSYDGNSPFPNASQLVGIFNYLIPGNEQIVSASLSGSFGYSIFQIPQR